MISGGEVKRGVVEAVAAPEYLAIRWRSIDSTPEGAVVGPGTRVEFWVEAAAGGSRLRVAESFLSPERRLTGGERGTLLHRPTEALAGTGTRG
jgi:hypothetical protein